MSRVRTTILQIADRWVARWRDERWDGSKGIFKFTQGPYRDAFEHHYVAAVLLSTPKSKFHRNEKLRNPGGRFLGRNRKLPAPSMASNQVASSRWM